MKINNIEINKNNPPYIIAEMSANNNGNIDNAYKIIDMAKQCGASAVKMQTYSQVAKFLASRRFTQDSYIEYLNTVFPRTADKRVQGKGLSVDTLSRNAKLAHDVLETQPGAEYGEGSWWQAFNSVTFITDHVQGRNADNRLYSSWFGGNQLRKKNALESALEFADAA